MAHQADGMCHTERSASEKQSQEKAQAVADAAKDSGQVAFEAAKEKMGHLVNGFKELQWEQVPSAVAEHIKKNPKMTAFQLVCLLVTVVPSLVATPALLALGFSSSGPIGGWLAATFQSIYGTPLAFRALQSAAMGGWGAGVVNAIIQGGTLALAGITAMFKPKVEKSKEEEEQDT